MKADKLTNPPSAAHSARPMGKRGRQVAMMAMAGLIPSGCVSVTAPDKPIVIELNINISQEVIYRLADDVRQNIEKNPGIF